MAPQSVGVLHGLQVVEFSQNAAAPHCGRLLAGMGADVVKIEPPWGDATRLLAPLGDNEGKGYAVINPGKRSMCLNLASDRRSEVIDALFGWADVALMGFKQSDLERYGLDWAHAHTVNPRLVQLVLTPFGPEGPDADEGGYDILLQALSGLGFLMNRTIDGVPTSSRPAFIDFATGMMSAAGVLAALRHRDQTGRGLRVDSSLLGTAMSLGTTAMSYFGIVDAEPIDGLKADLELLRKAGADFETQREVYESRVVIARGAFRFYFRHYATADGLVSVAGLSPGLYEKFHEITGLPRPPDDGDPATPEFQAVIEAAETLFATRTTQDWLDTLRSVGYPCARYNMPFEAVNDPQVRANDFTVDLEHPTFGPYTTTGIPVQFEEAPTAVPGPSPRLGEHTTEVLAELQFTPAEIESLVTHGVVATGDGQRL